MLTQILDTNSAGKYAYFAGQDVRMRNNVNKTHFSTTQHNHAERVKLALEMVYGCKEVHIDWRKNICSIKVDSVRCVNDRKNLELLEGDYEKMGAIKIRTTAGHIIYRFPKA